MFEVYVTRAEGVKCPRCWKLTGEGRFNYDGLCDPCCRVILADYPQHESAPFIQSFLRSQKEMATYVV